MKNKLVLDLHTHTLASGHAYGTIRENALAAHEKGLAGLGVSEHAPGMPGTFRELQHLGPKKRNRPGKFPSLLSG